MKKVATEWKVLYGFLAFVLIIVLGIIIFGKCTSNPIDGDSLACRWKGSVADIIGLLLFIVGLISLAGLGDVVASAIAKKDVDVNGNLESKSGTNYVGVVSIIIAFIGFGIIYLN